MAAAITRLIDAKSGAISVRLNDSALTADALPAILNYLEREDYRVLPANETEP